MQRLLLCGLLVCVCAEKTIPLVEIDLLTGLPVGEVPPVPATAPVLNYTYTTTPSLFVMPDINATTTSYLADVNATTSLYLADEDSDLTPDFDWDDTSPTSVALFRPNVTKANATNGTFFYVTVPNTTSYLEQNATSYLDYNITANTSRPNYNITANTSVLV